MLVHGSGYTNNILDLKKKKKNVWKIQNKAIEAVTDMCVGV